MLGVRITPIVPLLSLLILAAPLDAQTGAREWEVGPTFRRGGGDQIGPEVRRSIRVTQRLDTRIGGSALWTVAPAPLYGFYGFDDMTVDNRRQRFVGTASVDARFALLSGQLGSVFVLGGLDIHTISWGEGLHYQRENGVEHESGLEGRITLQPGVNFGAAFELARHISFEVRLELVDDPAPGMSQGLASPSAVAGSRSTAPTIAPLLA
jgi:hypothetical protein